MGFRLIPVRRNLLLGIAKLLPQVVPVKGETLQVVSLAMTRLMRGSNPVFHIVENRRWPRLRKACMKVGFSLDSRGAGLPRAATKLVLDALQKELTSDAQIGQKRGVHGRVREACDVRGPVQRVPLHGHHP
jgi:hypothetical protein